MKTPHSSIALIFLFFTGITLSGGQTCPQESLNFIDQFSIDQFSIDYPDCETTYSSVTISGSMNNLDGLSKIKVIKGDLIIEYNSELEDLSGLHNLDSVFGNVVINQNFKLSNLNGIREIKFIGGQFNLNSNELMIETETFVSLDSLDVLIISNSNLSTLSAFSQVRHANRLLLSGNHLITNLDGLSSLEFVQQIELIGNSQLITCDNPFICESLHNPAVIYYIENNGAGCNNYFDILESCQVDCPASFFFSSQVELDQFVFPTATCDQIRGSIHIHDAVNTPIMDLGPLSGITRIDSSLVIMGNPEITSLSILENLVYVGGDLNISDNPLLTNLNGLENLERVGGDCKISSCPQLSNLEGLSGLTYVGRDLAIGNNSLENLNGLNNLDTINRHLQIGSEVVLQTLEGLDDLQSINGYILFIFNDGLQSMDGVSNLTHIGGLHVGYNKSLLEMDALSGITSIPGDMIIYENQELLRMPPLPLVDSLGRYLQLYGNDQVTDLQGLKSFQSIGGRVEIRDMPALESLEGLENVTHIDGYIFLSKTGIQNLDALHNLLTMNGSLTIRDNENLTSITGLDQVSQATIFTPTLQYDLRITGNDLLTLCSSPPICGILQNPDNFVLVSGNATGCDTEEEVLAGCMVAVHDVDDNALIEIFPNPASSEVNIEVESLIEVESIEVYDVLGVIVYKGTFQKSFSFSSFGAGNYLMIFRTKDNQVLRKHVVVMKG